LTPCATGSRRKADTDNPEAPSSWVSEIIEVESGKKSDRPKLARAIEACRKHRARLVIAKLDRLSRNLAFVATLMESGVEFASSARSVAATRHVAYV
jgi:DNA invertase Pin-like site-specific DNA recombinase